MEDAFEYMRNNLPPKRRGLVIKSIAVVYRTLIAGPLLLTWFVFAIVLVLAFGFDKADRAMQAVSDIVLGSD